MKFVYVFPLFCYCMPTFSSEKVAPAKWDDFVDAQQFYEFYSASSQLKQSSSLSDDETSNDTTWWYHDNTTFGQEETFEEISLEHSRKDPLSTSPVTNQIQTHSSLLLRIINGKDEQKTDSLLSTSPGYISAQGSH